MGAMSMELRSVAALGQALASADTPAAVLATVADSARGMLPFGACALMLPATDGWAVWRAPAGRRDALTIQHTFSPEARAVLDRFAALAQPLRIDDLLAPPWQSSAHRDLLWKDGTRAALLFPLIAAGEARGTLVFTAFRPDVYREIDLEFAAFVAWLVALAVRALPADSEESLHA